MAAPFDPTDPQHLSPEQLLGELTPVRGIGVRRLTRAGALITRPRCRPRDVGRVARARRKTSDRTRLLRCLAHAQPARRHALDQSRGLEDALQAHRGDLLAPSDVPGEILLGRVVDADAPLRRAQKFPEAASRKIALSGSASAGSRLSRASSCSSVFSRFAWSTFSPPYSLRQR